MAPVAAALRRRLLPRMAARFLPEVDRVTAVTKAGDLAFGMGSLTYDNLSNGGGIKMSHHASGRLSILSWVCSEWSIGRATRDYQRKQSKKIVFEQRTNANTFVLKIHFPETSAPGTLRCRACHCHLGTAYRTSDIFNLWEGLVPDVSVN